MKTSPNKSRFPEDMWSDVNTRTRAPQKTNSQGQSFHQEGQIRSRLAPGNPDYSLRAALIVTAESGDRRMVRLDNFQFHTEIRLPDQVHDVSIGTSIDIYEGQHAVVGKASVGDSALILIMSARIIN